MNNNIEHTRRELLGTAASLGLLAATPTVPAATTSSKGAAMSSIPAFRGSERLKPLSFNPAKLNG